ncbi:MAG: hypothetical protein JJ964_10410 [Rhizobiales bacterium]|nr:hypothetical protein [Hyphomicrobiales bacterium]
MSQNQNEKYEKKDGKLTINSNLERAKLRYPNSDNYHDINLSVTEAGHLTGFVQPASPTQKLHLRAVKKQIANGTFQPNLPSYAKLDYREIVDQNGEVRMAADFVFEDVNINGKPLTLPAGSPSVFIFTEKLSQFENKPFPKKGEKEPAALHAYAVDAEGNLYTPACWRRKGNDGQTFFSGHAKEFDRKKYLANKKSSEPVME